MATDVTMPRLSDSMEEGTVLKWLVEEGGEVKRGEPLVEIETDKANMTYEADTDGTLIEIVAQEGDTLAIGEVIARIGEPSEAGEKPAEAGEGRAPKRKRPATRPSRSSASRCGAAAEGEAKAVAGAGDGGGETQAGTATKERAPSNGDGGRVKASPVARRMARELGVELARLEGSGPGGRIVKADVQAAAESGAAAPGDGADEGRRGDPGGARSAPRPASRSAARPAPRARPRSRSSRACSRRSAGGWPSRRRPRPTSRSRSPST